MGQAEELRALTTKVAADMAGPFDACGKERRTGTGGLYDPAVTVALLKANAVVGVTGFSTS
jgi:hypothetical protein